MAEPRILILCGRSPRHLYVANRLCRAAEPIAIVQETGTQWTARKVARLLRPRNLARKASRWVRDRKRYRGGGEAKFFFPGAEPALDRPERQADVAHINDPAVVEICRREHPDLITVFGTSLIRNELLGEGRLGIVNLHGGLSPHYRGADCTFWALYNNEPDQIGCTLHYIDAGIDTGKLIAHVSPAVHEDDDELTLFWRAVKDSAEVYADLVEKLARGEAVGQAQPGKGRLYQVKDRTAACERGLEQRLRAGLLRGVDLPPRVRWFGAEQNQERAASA